MEDIHRATRRYEEWLGGLIPLVRADLRAKHRRMREGPFFFMRATFYRWCQLWRARAKELGDVARGGARRGGRRPAPRELRHLARHRRAAHLGDQRLRRDDPAPLDAGSGAPRRPARTWRSSPTTSPCGGAPPARRSSRATATASRRAGGRSCSRRRTAGSAAWPLGELRHPTTFWEKMDGLRTAPDVDRGAAAAIAGAMPAARSADPLRPPRRRAGEPRPAALRRHRRLARRARRARGEGHRAVGLGLGVRRQPPAAADRYTRDHRPRRARPRSDGPRRRRLAGAAPGAPLRAHRARRSAVEPRRGAAALRDGVRDGQRPPRHAARARRSCASSSPPAAGTGCTRPPRRLTGEVVRDWREWRAMATRGLPDFGPLSGPPSASEHLEPHRHDARLEHPQLARGPLGEVDDPAARAAAAIVDPHRHRAPVGAADAHAGAERQRREAAVMAFGSKRSPEAVLRPAKPRP